MNGELLFHVTLAVATMISFSSVGNDGRLLSIRFYGTSVVGVWRQVQKNAAVAM